MTELLEAVLAEVKKLPEDKQNEIAGELIAYLLNAADDDRDLQLSDEQLAEVHRRRTNPGASIILDEVMGEAVFEGLEQIRRGEFARAEEIERLFRPPSK